MRPARAARVKTAPCSFAGRRSGPGLAPRDVDVYDARASASARSHELAIPALYIGATHDPVVPALARANDALEVRWVDRGGHVGFTGNAFAEGSVEAAALTSLDGHGV